MFAYTEGPFSFWTILLFSLCFGVASGVLYEGMRFLRVAMEMILTCKSKSTFLVRFAIVFLLDLLFFICISVAAVLFLFVCNRGQLRLSILGMMAFGFYLYNVNIGRHVRRMHRRVLKFV